MTWRVIRRAVGGTPRSLAVTWCVVFAVACAKPAPAPPHGVAVRIAPVEKISKSVATRYSAQIVPSVKVDLAFKVGDYVESIAMIDNPGEPPRKLQEGDTVTTGQVLARVRKTGYVQRVAEARAAVAQAYSLYRDAKLEAARDAKLVGTGSLSQSAADTTRMRRDSASAALEGARARFAQARTALGDTDLVSPMDGIVVKRLVEVGALAVPGTLAFTIEDVSSVKAVFGVPDMLLPQVQLGTPLAMTTDAYPDVVFEGKVTRLAPAADQRSRVFEVDVTIPNPDGKLKAGTVAALSVSPPASGAADLPVVPLNAIVRRRNDPGFAVYVVEASHGSSRVRARPVLLGDYLGRVVPVKQGLVGGESVVVQGAGLLSDGEQIEVIQ